MGTPKRASRAASGGLGSVADALSGSAVAAASSVSDAAGTLGEGIRTGPDRIQEGTAGSPLVAGALAFGIGMLVGSMAPPAPEETRMAERIMDPLQHEVQDLSRQLADAAKSHVQEAMEQTKTLAKDAADEVKDHAQSAAQAVTSQAGDAKDQVIDQAGGTPS